MSEMTREDREAAARDWWAKKQIRCDASQAADAAGSAEFVARKAVKGCYIITDDRGILHPKSDGTVDQIPPADVIDIRTTPPACSDADARLAVLIDSLRGMVRHVPGDWSDVQSYLAEAESPAPVPHPTEAKVKDLEAEQLRLGAVVDAQVGVIHDLEAELAEMRQQLAQQAERVEQPATAPEPGSWIDGPPTHEGIWERHWDDDCPDRMRVEMRDGRLLAVLDDGVDEDWVPTNRLWRHYHQSRYVGPLPEVSR